MIGGLTGRPNANSTGPGSPTPTPYTGPAFGRSASSRLELVPDGGEDGVGAGRDVARAVAAGEQPAGQVGDAYGGRDRAQRRDEDDARLGPEAQLARGASTGRGGQADLLHQTALEQRVHALGDDAATQAGGLAQLRTRACRLLHG